MSLIHTCVCTFNFSKPFLFHTDTHTHYTRIFTYEMRTQLVLCSAHLTQECLFCMILFWLRAWKRDCACALYNLSLVFLFFFCIKKVNLIIKCIRVYFKFICTCTVAAAVVAATLPLMLTVSPTSFCMHIHSVHVYILIMRNTCAHVELTFFQSTVWKVNQLSVAVEWDRAC